MVNVYIIIEVVYYVNPPQYIFSLYWYWFLSLKLIKLMRFIDCINICVDL